MIIASIYNRFVDNYWEMIISLALEAKTKFEAWNHLGFSWIGQNKTSYVTGEGK